MFDKELGHDVRAQVKYARAGGGGGRGMGLAVGSVGVRAPFRGRAPLVASRAATKAKLAASSLVSCRSRPVGGRKRRNQTKQEMRSRVRRGRRWAAGPVGARALL